MKIDVVGWIREFKAADDSKRQQMTEYVADAVEGNAMEIWTGVKLELEHDEKAREDLAYYFMRALVSKQSLQQTLGQIHAMMAQAPVPIPPWVKRAVDRLGEYAFS